MLNDLSRARTGDVILEQGKGIGHWIIRGGTGQGISHIGVLVWYLSTLYVVDMSGTRGYQVTELKKWLKARKGHEMFYGVAPSQVRSNPAMVIDAISAFEGRPVEAKYWKPGGKVAKKLYGYHNLIRVWIDNILMIKPRHVFKVCSTYVQLVWEGAGYEFDRTATPGRFMWLCDAVYPIRID